MKLPRTMPEIVDDLTRREFLVGAGLMALVPGCGSGGEETSANARTIEHKFGATEISGSPRRVVSVGYTDHDYVLALGATPIAVRYWYADDVIFTWADDEVERDAPEVLNMPEGLNFERIATLEPDLIVGLYSGMTENDFELLSEIAPTVPQSGEYIDYGMPWQQTTVMMGEALGQKELARELVSDVEGRFERARENHPEFEGKTVAVADYVDGVFTVLASSDVRARFFTSLGFAIPEEYDELAGDEFVTNLSAERVDLLDTDVLVWRDATTFEDAESNEIFDRLDVVREGRVVILEGDYGEAYNWQTILSLPFALDKMVPEIEDAVSKVAEATNP